MEEIKKNLLEYFKDLEFNAEKHSYYYEGNFLPSVSSLIKNYVEPFEAKKVAVFTARKRSKLEGREVTPEEVLLEWDNKRIFSCDKGNRIHNFGENIDYLDLDKSIPTDNYEKSVLAFWKSLPKYIVPVIFELKMYSKALKYAGTMDILLYNTVTKKFIIADYKTNEDLFKNYKGKKMLGVFDNLLDSPFNKYQLQLSYYQILLEQVGYDIESRIIVWIKEDGFEIYKTEDMTSILKQELIKNKK